MKENEKQLTPLTQFRNELNLRSTSLKSVLPEHITVEKFMRLTMTAAQRTPELLTLNRDSLFQAVSDCATDGLIPDGREAALVKFGSNVTYMPMVGGILKKIRQSGELLAIIALVVYENDKFDYWIDENGPHLDHHPMLTGEPGAMIAVYASAQTKDGGKYVEVLTLAEITKIRNSSKMKNAGPWSDWTSEMAKKSAIRRLSKRMPMSTDIEKVVTRDDQFYDFDEQRNVTPDIDTGHTASNVKSKLKSKVEPVTEEDEEDIEQPVGEDGQTEIF